MSKGKLQFRRRVIGPHSSRDSIMALDRRTNIAKALRKITNDLLAHVGDPTPPQRIIVQGAAFKALRIALFSDRMLNEPDALSEGSDHNLLAWSNSLRHDLLALGLEKRERPTIDLAAYLARRGYVPADAASAGEPATTDASTDAAA